MRVCENKEAATVDTKTSSWRARTARHQCINGMSSADNSSTSRHSVTVVDTLNCCIVSCILREADCVCVCRSAIEDMPRVKG